MARRWLQAADHKLPFEVMMMLAQLVCVDLYADFFGGVDCSTILQAIHPARPARVRTCGEDTRVSIVASMAVLERAADGDEAFAAFTKVGPHFGGDQRSWR